MTLFRLVRILLHAFLARAACMPYGHYVLLALISFFNKPLSKENSGSTGPIFHYMVGI